MDALELMRTRHCVRSYTDRPIEAQKRQALAECADACNREGGLHLQVIYDEPGAFTTGMAHYGSFHDVTNYIAVVGEKARDLDLRCGYYGQRLVLKAQELGLNTCWVVLTYGRRSVTAKIGPSEKLVGVVALGYGQTQGIPHKSKPAEKLRDMPDDAPEWYVRGVEGAMLAPTATNQQKFHISLEGGQAVATRGLGTYTLLDLGIVRHDFEAASGHELKVQV